MLRSLIIVGAGSFAGGALRYLTSQLMKPVSDGFPFGTFCVNIIGCFLIGLLYGLFAKYSSTSSDWCLLLTTGLCGGFTTFSTFCNESVSMAQNGNWGTLALYIGGSVALGLLAVLLGSAVAAK